jgi:hypothetical protein
MGGYRVYIDITDTLFFKLVFLQSLTNADLFMLEWSQIEQTIRAASSMADHYLEEQLPVDAEASQLDFINSAWVQRVAPKMVACSLEEHPEAHQASIYWSKKFSEHRQTKVVFNVITVHLLYGGVTGSQ